MDKLKINYPIIVEGKYDRLRLISLVDANIYTTEGFGIFKKNEKLALLRKLAERSPIIVLTDSDGAGKLIRSHITSALPKEKIIQLYIPKIEGKEKRKAEPSAEGILGVEGMERELLINLLSPYATSEAYEASLENPLSKTDFYIDGLLGGENSSNKRDELCLSLGLPTKMTPNALLAALRMLVSYDEYLKHIRRNEEN